MHDSGARPASPYLPHVQLPASGFLASVQVNHGGQDTNLTLGIEIGITRRAKLEAFVGLQSRALRRMQIEIPGLNRDRVGRVQLESRTRELYNRPIGCNSDLQLHIATGRADRNLSGISVPAQDHAPSIGKAVLRHLMCKPKIALLYGHIGAPESVLSDRRASGAAGQLPKPLLDRFPGEVDGDGLTSVGMHTPVLRVH